MENSYQPPQDHQERAQHVPAPHPGAPSKGKTGRTGLRGVEYIFLTIALVTAASSLIIVLNNWINSSFLGGQTDFYTMAFPVSALIISLPVFALLLMDVTRAERRAGAGRNPYKVWCSQIIRIIAFATCFFTLIWLIYGIFLHAGGEDQASLSILIVDSAVVVAVAGGILGYYMKGGSAES